MLIGCRLIIWPVSLSRMREAMFTLHAVTEWSPRHGEKLQKLNCTGAAELSGIFPVVVTLQEVTPYVFYHSQAPLCFAMTFR